MIIIWLVIIVIYNNTIAKPNSKIGHFKRRCRSSKQHTSRHIHNSYLGQHRPPWRDFEWWGYIAQSKWDCCASETRWSSPCTTGASSRKNKETKHWCTTNNATDIQCWAAEWTNTKSKCKHWPYRWHWTWKKEEYCLDPDPRLTKEEDQTVSSWTGFIITCKLEIKSSFHLTMLVTSPLSMLLPHKCQLWMKCSNSRFPSWSLWNCL